MKVDNCAKCADLDPLKTSCYADTCACNPKNGTCAVVKATLGSNSSSSAPIAIIVGVIVGVIVFAALGFLVAVKRGKIILKKKNEKVEAQNPVVAQPVVAPVAEVKVQAKEGSSTTSLSEKDNVTTQTAAASKNSKLDVEKVGSLGSRNIEGDKNIEAGIPTIVLPSTSGIKEVANVGDEGEERAVKLPL